MQDSFRKRKTADVVTNQVQNAYPVAETVIDDRRRMRTA